ncbi:molybdopterin-dependent oxidoreductase [Gloeobacter violaceus]|uniref:Gll2176 protein n=1 Tax=Gloeobacter violaceus (strain ATCC 29082 / PCC 7421) TaxID=251221 RepID=Q7NIK7_GLOVI|nr:molybdopterin-dependent oxidoreductase [Gloeobacter violaceus]BAC90117.1 gll2176 [Gloeobacter violaceus PCC 7421]
MRRRDILRLAGLGLGAAGGAGVPALAQNPAKVGARAAAGRLLVPQYRAAGAASFSAITWNKAWATVAERLLEVRASSWSEANRRAERLGVYCGTGLTNEEAYAWAKLARLSGARLERSGEGASLALARALEATFGVPAAPNHWLELSKSQAILVVGRAGGAGHPAFAAAQAAAQAGVPVWSLGEGQDASIGNALAVAPRGEVAVLGGLIRFIVENKRADAAFLDVHTNAAFRLLPEFGFQNGVFSGFDPKTRRYDPESWGYEFLENGRPARSEQIAEEGTVYAQIARFFAPYTLERAARTAGVGEAALGRFYREFTAPERRSAAIVCAIDAAAEPAAIEQRVRLAAIASLLLGQVGRPGGGIVVASPGFNPQGTADVGATGAMLPGYAGAPPLAGEDFIGWVQRHGVRNQRRLVAMLRSWYDTAAPDFGFAALPCSRPGEPTLRGGNLEMLVCVGADPLAEGNWPLEKLKTLVVLDHAGTNRTARFWQGRGAARTEVLFLPLAHPDEREGTTTDSGRRIVLLSPASGPRGQSQTGLTTAASLWEQIGFKLASRTQPREESLREARWWRETTPAAVWAEMVGADLGNPAEVDGAANPRELRCGVAIYAGASGEKLAGRRERGEDGSGLGLYPAYGYPWPGDVRVIANRASADLQGNPRLAPPFMRWDGKAWSGPDTPDIANPANPDDPAATRSFRGTPEGVARLFAAYYAAGLNLDTGIAFLPAALPAGGPLPFAK